MPFRHEWRAAWARYGDAAEGRPTFEALRESANAVLLRIVGDARLPNEIRFDEAVRQQVLRPAIHDHAPRRTATVQTVHEVAPSNGAFPAPTAPHLVTIDRPVFVVSSPRAGSSLLFETLARAPHLY
jgi:hypothetical protein